MRSGSRDVSKVDSFVPPPNGPEKAVLVEASAVCADDYEAAEEYWTSLVQGVSASQLSPLPFHNQENPALVLGLWLVHLQCLSEAERVVRLALSYHNLDEDLLFLLGEVKLAQGELRSAVFNFSMLAKQAARDCHPIVRLGVQRRDEVQALLDMARDSLNRNLED